jgi:hypothetical protein
MGDIRVQRQTFFYSFLLIFLPFFGAFIFMAKNITHSRFACLRGIPRALFCNFHFSRLGVGVLKGGDMGYKRAWSSDRYLQDDVGLSIDNSIILIDMTRGAQHVIVQCCSVTF